MPDPVQVRSMFARIAGSYDLLNRLLSAGIDQRWRGAAVRLAGDCRGKRVVDLCCGTGDLALQFRRRGARVLGLDFTPQMLVHAQRKGAGEVLFAQADALRLPCADASVEIASVAFGIRNVADRRACLLEMRRVLRPGGLVMVLEFSMPPGALLGRLYRGYFTRLLPLVGRLLSKDQDAYSYLPRSVLAWPSPAAFEAEFREADLVECGYRRLSFGIACLHFGRVAGASQSP